jgi:hypothetical protein
MAPNYWMIVNNELEGIWKDGSCPNSSYCSDTDLERVRIPIHSSVRIVHVPADILVETNQNIMLS